MPKHTICLVSLFFCTAQLPAGDYWVAPNGSDSDAGSKQQPFLTIQKAADIMRPGDTCTVREGTYRESVTIRRSGTEGKPIRFVAADGERVALDGTESVAGEWSQYKGSIYCTTIAGPIEQVFVDGRMQIEARWPNMRFEEIWDRTKWAKSDHGSRKDLMVCDALAKTGIDWTDALATLNVGHQYKTWTRDVTKQSKAGDEFAYELNERLGDGRDSGPTWADDYFYLSGILEALDAPTEWYYDTQSGRLYLWCDDNKTPAEHEVAVKRRTYAIDAFGRDYVEIVGFHFFAATLRFNQCNRCLVDRCHLKFPVYSRRFEERTAQGERKPEPATVIDGNHNTIRNTSIAFSNLGGLLVKGQHCRVENCIIHDVNWGGSISHAGISLHGSADEGNHNAVSRCTVYGVGNIGILYRGRANTIEYNHVFDTGRACRDIAAIHTGGVRAMGSVAHHNWVHGSSGIGMRGDDQTRGLTFHHNVIWDCHRGMIMKGNLNNVYHNTVLVDPESEHSTASIVIPKRAEPKKWWTRNPTLPVQNEDTVVFNNAAFLVSDRGGTSIRMSDRVSNNLILPRDLKGIFVNASKQSLERGTFDLRPAPDSPLTDKGRYMPGVTIDYKGRAPDIGAYETDGELWTAGAAWQDEPIGIEMAVRLEPANKHFSIPLPKTLSNSGIRSKGLRSLQKLYDELWTVDDRVSDRKKAIALRERYPKDSADHQKHHAVVTRLHREVWLLLRDRGAEVLNEKDVAAFKKATGTK